MTLVRWDPFGAVRWPNIWEDEDWTPTTSSSMDVYETEHEVVVSANVPGVSDDKVELTFEKGILWIRGEETLEDQEEKKYYRKAQRSFSYKVAVPGNLDLKHDPEATVEHGVVTVKFRKAEESKPKKISVKRS